MQWVQKMRLFLRGRVPLTTIRTALSPPTTTIIACAHRRLLTMASTTTPKYTCTVTKTPPPLDSIPADPSSLKAHHVKSASGQHIKFQNPHPSVGEVLSTFGILKK